MFEIVITVHGRSEKYLVDKLPVTISHSPAVSVVIKDTAQQNVQRTACAMCGGEDLHKEGCAYEGFVAQPAAANANRWAALGSTQS